MKVIRSNNSLFMEVLQALIKNDVADEQREAIYYDIVEAFENYDQQCVMECEGKDAILDAIIEDRYPTFEDEED